MITQISIIDIKPGNERDFESAAIHARPLFMRAKGSIAMELHRSIEKPSQYRLIARWETLENHAVDFRSSDAFADWRTRVARFFAKPPAVEYTEPVFK
jgi:heme-degrading monooxygenase HmoA